jgi:small subunit ribosomal protein S18
MGKPSAKRSPKQAKDTGRKFKKKVSILNSEKIEYVDWKDVDLLRRFMSDRAKIRARRVNGNDTQQQREIAKAIKNAREMALLPYTSRVTTQRGGKGDRRGRGERGDRGERRERAPQDDAPRDAAAPAAEGVTPDAEVAEAAVQEVQS